MSESIQNNSEYEPIPESITRALREGGYTDEQIRRACAKAGGDPAQTVCNLIDDEGDTGRNEEARLEVERQLNSSK
jgi:hypothetical protein